jgi:hypothetical protein
MLPASLAERHEAHQRPGQGHRGVGDAVRADYAASARVPSKWMVKSGVHSGNRGERRSLPPMSDQTRARKAMTGGFGAGW